MPRSLARWEREGVQLQIYSHQGLAEAAELREKGASVLLCGTPSIPWVLDGLSAQGHQTVLCEGGGRFLHGLIAAGLLERLHLTICPVLLGEGLSLVEGVLPKQLPKMELVSCEAIGSEIYAVYDLK